MAHKKKVPPKGNPFGKKETPADKAKALKLKKKKGK